MKKILTRNIIIISVVSFFTDIASEMLYPVMPLYLKSIGYGVILVGLIEATAEAVSGFNKLFFGHLSDLFKRKKIFIQIGYGVSAVAKPLIGLIPVGAFVFFARVLDRAGKGIRTTPRDALITAETAPEYRSRAFGFHRSIDTLGAVLGPVVAFLLLLKYPGQYALICVLALIPGLIALGFTFYIKEKPIVEENVNVKTVERNTFKGFREFFKTSPLVYKKLVLGFFLVALINSSNMFLILRAKEQGVTDMFILFGYIAYNIVYALACYPVGVVADKFGHKKLYITSIILFALTYMLFGSNFPQNYVFILLFSLYGIFSAIEETTGKSWLSLHIPEQSRGKGFGLHLGLNTIGFLVGSILAGVLWHVFGSTYVFTGVGFIALAVATYFIRLKNVN